MRARAEAPLKRLGFVVVGADLLRVAAPGYDRHRAQRAKVNLESRGVEVEAEQAGVEAARLEVLREVRGHRAADQRDAALTESELKDAVRQAIHELGLKDRLRGDEMARLEQRLAHDLADFEQQRTQQREEAAEVHARGLDADRRGHEREQTGLDLAAFIDRRIREAEGAARVADSDRGTTEKNWDLARRMRDDAIAARRRKHMDDVDVERARAETLARADTATKIALGVGDTQALLELERMDREGRMSPEQLLIVAAERSPEVAAALAERFRAEGRMNEELMDHLKRQIESDRQRDREYAARLERMNDRALDHMGRVVSARAAADGPGDQTIVTGGGLGGPPVIIQAARGASGHPSSTPAPAPSADPPASVPGAEDAK